MCKEELVKNVFNGYIDMALDEDFIIYNVNGYSELEECRDLEDNVDYELVEELNNLTFKLFEENGYEAYDNFYVKDGIIKNVFPDTIVFIKEEN